MFDSALGASRTRESEAPAAPASPAAKPGPRGAWLIVALAVILLSAGFVVVTRTRPGYDAFGWLVWGRQTLHWNLNTDGAPSWKPVVFLFTLPYSLAPGAQQWLWEVTAVAAALGGAVFAARIAYKLTGPCPGRYAAIIAAALAAIGVLGIDGYSHLLLIANSDPMIVTLCLAAIDSHLSGRPRLAFVMMVLAALGRPEVWLFAGLYALWAWQAIASMRLLAVAGVALIPALWFSVPALTSKSWLTPGDLALNSMNVIHGSKIVGVLSRFHSLSALTLQLAALLGLALAIRRRDFVWLILAGAAVLWIVLEIEFAFHGWSAVPRYLIEPAAVTVVLAGATVGRLLGYVPGRRGGGSKFKPVAHGLLRLPGPVVVLALIASIVPYGRHYEQVTSSELASQRSNAKQLDRLQAVIASDGAGRIRRCGQPVTFVGFQSALAWDLGMNVGNVGFMPGQAIHDGQPIVVITPARLGWQVRTYHVRSHDRRRCNRLQVETTPRLAGTGPS